MRFPRSRSPKRVPPVPATWSEAIKTESEPESGECDSPSPREDPRPRCGRVPLQEIQLPLSREVKNQDMKVCAEADLASLLEESSSGECSPGPGIRIPPCARHRTPLPMMPRPDDRGPTRWASGSMVAARKAGWRSPQRNWKWKNWNGRRAKEAAFWERSIPCSKGSASTMARCDLSAGAGDSWTYADTPREHLQAEDNSSAGGDTASDWSSDLSASCTSSETSSECDGEEPTRQQFFQSKLPPALIFQGPGICVVSKPAGWSAEMRHSQEEIGRPLGLEDLLCSGRIEPLLQHPAVPVVAASEPVMATSGERDIATQTRDGRQTFWRLKLSEENTGQRTFCACPLNFISKEDA
eukprot:g31799.t1